MPLPRHDPITGSVPRLARACRWLLLAAVCLAAGTVLAEPELLDRILAIVDEEAILQSDLEYEVEAYRMEAQYAGQPVPDDSPSLRQEVLERLIETKLIIAAAKQADMGVDEEAIEQSVEQRCQQYEERFGSREAFERELIRSGTTYVDFRNRMRTQLRDQQFLRLVMGRFIRPKVEVMENEVRDYYLAHLDEMPMEPDSLTIANILVPVQPALEVRQEIQDKVAEVRSALAAGESFADVARRFSQGPNAARGGAVGTVSPGDLFDQALDRAVFGLAEGEVSDPVISSRGVHVIKLDAVHGDGRRTISQVFLPMEVTQEDVDAAENAISQARERVLGGEAFSLVAAEVSGDPVSAARGGVLGTFSLTDLSEQFQTVLVEAQEGDITEPLLTPAGWYIFQVLERRPGHMFTYDELHPQLRQMVEGQKMQEALEEHVQELRTRFFVEIKP